jgi:mono/diheme cytochrome c family protein
MTNLRRLASAVCRQQHKQDRQNQRVADEIAANANGLLMSRSGIFSSSRFPSRLSFACVLAIAAALLLLARTGMAAQPARGESPATKRGDALFHRNCVICHNKAPGNYAPFGPPNLHGVFQRKVVTPAQTMSIIRHGKGQMPPFAGRLKPEQIRDLIAYLKTQ